jgi:hypothetical protein
MKQYPSIPGSRSRKLPLGENCIGFYKYDGSNLRWEWSRKRGFYKFGTRHRLFGPDEAPYNQAIDFFKAYMAKSIENTMVHHYPGITDFIAFTEFFGPSSFAGSHDLEEKKELKLFDIWVPKKGLIPPREFINKFGSGSWVAKPIYDGIFHEQLITDVREGRHQVVEGMVVKGINGDWMAKIKTDAYLAKLKETFGTGWTKFAE